MQIKPAKDPENTFPRTRRELLSHLWGVGLGTANIFREGAVYAPQCGGMISATHLRRIGSWSFADWEKEAKFTASLRKTT